MKSKKIGADILEPQPIFLYHDSEKAYNLRRAYKKRLDALNDLIIVYNCDMKTELTEADLKEVMTDAKAFVQKKKNEIKEIYPFVSANRKFNEEALGITFDNIDKSISELTNSDYHYLVTPELTFIEDESELERLIGDCDIYTANERQFTVMTTALEICEKLNILLDIEAITPEFVRRGFSALIYHNNGKFEVDPKRVEYK